jgi:predicted RNase H-like nuclease (RuvC/YqgF family)
MSLNYYKEQLEIEIESRSDYEEELCEIEKKIQHSKERIDELKDKILELEKQGEDPNQFDIECQFCSKFKDCDHDKKTCGDDSKCSNFRVTDIRKACNFLKDKKCMHKKNYKKYCLPGDCPLRKTKEYQKWVKI